MNRHLKKFQYILLWIYKLGFDIVYGIIIGNYFAYANYKNDFNFVVYIVTLLIFAFFSLHINQLVNNNTPFSTFLFLLEIGYFIPALTYCTFNNVSPFFIIFLVLYWGLLVIYYSILNKRTIIIKRLKNNFLYPLMVILWIVGAAYICNKYRQFSLSLSLTNVYTLRDLQSTLHMSRLASYFLPMAGTLLPILVIYFLIDKKIILSLVTTLVLIATFSFGGMKKYLFYMVLAYLLYFFYKKRDAILFILPGLCLTHVLAIVEFCVKNGMPQIANYIHRRTMLLPVTLSYYYFDFFSKNQKDFLSQGIFRRFGLESTYNMPIQNMIGGLYNGSYANVASNGMIGNAFANFGWLSLFIYPILIIVLLKCFGIILAQKAQPLIMLVGMEIFVLLTNGDFFTNLLSNGLIALFILLLLMPRKEKRHGN